MKSFYDFIQKKFWQRHWLYYVNLTQNLFMYFFKLNLLWLIIFWFVDIRKLKIWKIFKLTDYHRKRLFTGAALQFEVWVWVHAFQAIAVMHFISQKQNMHSNPNLSLQTGLTCLQFRSLSIKDHVFFYLIFLSFI